MYINNIFYMQTYILKIDYFYSTKFNNSDIIFMHIDI